MINDTLGHAFGDELLRRVAARLQGVLRASDTIARLGGDEFVILAGSANPDYVTQLAQKIVDQLRVPFPVFGESLSVTCSLGIAMFPDSGADGQQLLRAADMAMYTAKAEGRNRYHVYACLLYTSSAASTRPTGKLFAPRSTRRWSAVRPCRSIFGP